MIMPFYVEGKEKIVKGRYENIFDRLRGGRRWRFWVGKCLRREIDGGKKEKVGR